MSYIQLLLQLQVSSKSFKRLLKHWVWNSPFLVVSDIGLSWPKPWDDWKDTIDRRLYLPQTELTSRTVFLTFMDACLLIVQHAQPWSRQKIKPMINQATTNKSTTKTGPVINVCRSMKWAMVHFADVLAATARTDETVFGPLRTSTKTILSSPNLLIHDPQWRWVWSTVIRRS